MKEELGNALGHSVQLWKMVDLPKELTLFTRLVKEKGEEVTWLRHFPTSYFHQTLFTRSSLVLQNMSRKLHSEP